MIEIRDLKFSSPGGEYHLRLDRLDFVGGQSTAVLGPSGCGKTTLLHLISGIRVPASGTVGTMGTEVSSLSEAERRDFR